MNTQVPSVKLTALGGFILIFGLIAFNAGSQGHITTKGDGGVVAMIVANTVIGGSFAAVMSLIIHKTGIFGTPKQWSFLFSLNGCLTGMVAICAGGHRIYSWGAAIIGVMSAIGFFVARTSILLIKVDDPLDAAAVHFTGGFIGLITLPFLDIETGLVFGNRDGMYLVWNLIGAVSICAWALVSSVILFGSLRRIGIFRVTVETELKGLDGNIHGELAYPLEGWLEEQYILQQPVHGKRERDYGAIIDLHPIMTSHASLCANENGLDNSRQNEYNFRKSYHAESNNH